MHMKEKIWCYLDLLKHIKMVKGALYGENAFLNKSGWRKSLYTRSIDTSIGGGIPWCTYSFIHFIESRLHKDFRVFEYGSGASTSYYAERCGHIVSIENDEAWLQNEKKRLKDYDNIELFYIPDGREFFEYIFVREEMFDIVIVDCSNYLEYENKGRVFCVQAALQKLSKGGVIIVDDMERLEYDLSFMEKQGFRRQVRILQTLSQRSASWRLWSVIILII